MSGMRARGWRRQGGAMDVTLGVRPGDDGTVVAVSGEVDVCTEAPLQQALLRIMREYGARLLLACPASRSWTAQACGRS
jgi:hypothetical protein